MVQTRSGQASTSNGLKPRRTIINAKNKTKTKDEVNTPVAKNDTESSTTILEKRKRNEIDSQTQDDVDKANDEQPLPNKTMKEDNEEKQKTSSIKDDGTEQDTEKGEIEYTVAYKIRKTIDKYGTLPLEGLGVNKPLEPSPEILLAMVIDSMLKSTRISHNLAQQASVKVFEASYYDIKVLSNTSWDDRVKVLSEGGYNRYREAAANKLGDLATLINEKYDGDLNNLRKKNGDNPSKIRQSIREIKGFGDVATDLFCDDAQAVWHVLAPTIDHRSLDTAEEVGIGREIEPIYAELGRDPVQMSKLARGLSAVRLSKSQGDIE